MLAWWSGKASLPCAPRWARAERRLVRQQLVQALMLAALGTLCGLLIASWVTPALFAMSPEGTDATGSAMREFDYAARIDWPVFCFAAGAMLLVGLGFGLLPAARASRTDLRGAINSTARGATLDRSTRRLLGSFVVIELAVAAALLMASITATQYFGKLLEEPWGFETERRVAFNATYSDRLFDTPAAKQRSIDATLAELRTLPGVENATVTAPSPMNAPRNLMSVNRGRRARAGAARLPPRVPARGRARLFQEHWATACSRVAISPRPTRPIRRRSAS